MCEWAKECWERKGMLIEQENVWESKTVWAKECSRKWKCISKRICEKVKQNEQDDVWESEPVSAIKCIRMWKCVSKRECVRKWENMNRKCIRKSITS